MDAASVTISVIGRYFMKSPMMPWPEQQWREGGDTRHGSSDDRAGHALGGQSSKACFLRHAFAHAPFGEFGDDDGIVHQHADRQDQAEQHDHVDRVAHQRQQQDADQEG